MCKFTCRDCFYSYRGLDCDLNVVYFCYLADDIGYCVSPESPPCSDFEIYPDVSFSYFSDD